MGTLPVLAVPKAMILIFAGASTRRGRQHQEPQGRKDEKQGQNGCCPATISEHLNFAYEKTQRGQKQGAHDQGAEQAHHPAGSGSKGRREKSERRVQPDMPLIPDSQGGPQQERPEQHLRRCFQKGLKRGLK